MPDETAEIVRSIGFELVTRLAPEELPLYPSLAGSAFSVSSGHMSTELAGRRPSAERLTRRRDGAFTLPVSTSFRFVLLITAVAAAVSCT